MIFQDSSIPNLPNVGSLVPPRPNLGPEPWPEGSGPPRWVVPTVGLALLIVSLAILNRRRKRSLASESTSIPLQPDDIEPSNRQRLIASSDQFRLALVRNFGPAWRSKTTEEIGRDPQIVDRLEYAEFVRLMTFLKLADRAKFAGDDPDSIDDWEAWTEAISKKLADCILQK